MLVDLLRYTECRDISMAGAARFGWYMLELMWITNPMPVILSQSQSRQLYFRMWQCLVEKSMRILKMILQGSTQGFTCFCMYVFYLLLLNLATWIVAFQKVGKPPKRILFFCNALTYQRTGYCNSAWLSHCLDLKEGEIWRHELGELQ